MYERGLFTPMTEWLSDPKSQRIIEHGIRVHALYLQFFGAPSYAVGTAAICHDVLEDGLAHIDDLIDWDFSEEAVELITTLTRVDESYADYIGRVRHNEEAAKIKICDLMHNMDLSRLENLDAHVVARQQKYAKALDRLWATLEHAGAVA